MFHSKMLIPREIVSNIRDTVKKWLKMAPIKSLKKKFLIVLIYLIFNCFQFPKEIIFFS